ncbi:hypothetical protein ACFVTZ_03860 [Cellulosimicrobium cellulans]|uniref:hypothetical protein n=1 Tax=Cellulosimicrobium cellulans TaxID=1710 RepID=UPI0036ED1A27
MRATPREHGAHLDDYSRGVVRATQELVRALEDCSTARELRSALLWAFVNLLARHEGKTHGIDVGAMAVAEDLELALHGWAIVDGDVRIVNRQAVDDFLLTAAPGRTRPVCGGNSQVIQ